MTYVCTQTIRTSFLVISLLFPTKMVKNTQTKEQDPKYDNLPKLETNPN